MPKICNRNGHELTKKNNRSRVLSQWELVSSDILAAAFAMLTGKELHVVSAVCTIWAAVCKEKQKLCWIKVCSAGTIDRAWMQAAATLKLKPEQLTEMRHLEFVKGEHSDDSIERLASMLTGLKNVQSLDVQHLTPAQVEKVMQYSSFPSLAQLSARGSKETKTGSMQDGTLQIFARHAKAKDVSSIRATFKSCASLFSFHGNNVGKFAALRVHCT